MHLNDTTTALDFAHGAATHLQRARRAIDQLSIEHNNMFGNRAKVAQLADGVKFELAWAVSDLDRTIPAVAGVDQLLAGALGSVRTHAARLVDNIGAGRLPTPVPDAYPIERGFVDAWNAARLLEQLSAAGTLAAG